VKRRKSEKAAESRRINLFTFTFPPFHFLLFFHQSFPRGDCFVICAVCHIADFDSGFVDFNGVFGFAVEFVNPRQGDIRQGNYAASTVWFAGREFLFAERMAFSYAFWLPETLLAAFFIADAFSERLCHATSSD
jgi:hypothetical protein